jgi:hypothetical protein
MKYALLTTTLAALLLTSCVSSSSPSSSSLCECVPASVAEASLENQKRINALTMGLTLSEVERVMGRGPERRHASLRFDGVAIEEWSYSSDPFRKLDTVITFVGGKVHEINTASWERRRKERDPRETQ